MKNVRNAVRMLMAALLVMVCSCSAVVVHAEEESPVGWRLFRLAGGVNTDGETCDAEDFVETFWFGLHSSGSGFVYSQSGARAFDWGYNDEDTIFIVDHPIVLDIEDSGNLRMIGREYDYQTGLPYVTLQRADEANESGSMEGLWSVSDPINVLDVMEVEPQFRFQADGTLRQIYDENSLAGALVGEVNMGLWMCLDGKLLNMESGREEVSVINYTVIPEKDVEKKSSGGEEMRYLEIDDGTQLPVIEFPVKVPLHYDSPVRYAAWSGIWSVEGESEDGHICMTVQLNDDGTGTYVVSDNLAQPGQVFESADIAWQPVPEGARLEVDSSEGVKEMIMSGERKRVFLSVEDRKVQMKENPWLPALVESAQQCGADLLALAGVWDYEGGVEELAAAQLELRLDGSAIMRYVTGEADPRDRRLFTDTNCRWTATSQGINLIYMNDLGEDAGEIVLQDGKLTQDGLSFVHTVKADAWNGDGYDHEPLAYYMSTGYVGVWSDKGYLVTNDPFDPEDQIELRLAADGRGVLWIACKGSNDRIVQGDLKWRPADGGVEFCMLTEVAGLPWLRTDCWFSAKYYSGEKRLSWYEAGKGFDFIKKNDYWDMEKTVAEAEPILSYNLLDDGTAVLTEFFTEAAVVEIPQSIDGHAVSALGANLFSGNRSIQQVTVPEGVVEIGACAFAECPQLKKVELPDSLSVIGDSAFSGSHSAAIELPVYLKSVGSMAFQNCSGLREAEFDLDGFVIGASAFSGSAVMEVSFYGVGGTIGENAFYGCRQLTEADLSDFEGTIGDGAFAWCSALSELELPQEECVIGANVFCGCGALEDVCVPGEVREITAGMFKECGNLRTVVVEEGVQRISDSAFYECSGLTSVTLPKGLVSIGMGAFQYCTELPYIQIPEGVVELGMTAFDGCSALKQAVLPASLQKIDNWAFRGCKDLEKLHVPNAGAELLYGILDETHTVLVGKSGSTAEAYAWENGLEFTAEDMTSVAVEMASSDVFAMELRSDGNYCIVKYTGTEQDVVIPAEYNGVAITAIGAEAFSRIENLRSVIIAPNIREIGDKAFFGCSELLSVVIPVETNVFGRFVFVNCPQLTVQVGAGTAAEEYADANRLQKSITG